MIFVSLNAKPLYVSSLHMALSALETPTFHVQLPVFEGPYDLLLFFIEKDELDIHDIPIADLSARFFAYLSQMEEMALDLAGDFVRVAATLMRIKARMLLPTAPALTEEAEEGHDPRGALVEQLLRYRRYRTGAEALRHAATTRALRSARGLRQAHYEALQTTYLPERSLSTLSLHKLLSTYHNQLQQHHHKRQQPRRETAIRYPYTVEEQKKQLLLRLSTAKHLHFMALLPDKAPPPKRRLLAVFNLMATLELWQQQKIKVQSSDNYNNFYLYPLAATPSPKQVNN